MKTPKFQLLDSNWHSLAATIALLFLIAGCQQGKTEENTKTDRDVVNEEVTDDRYFGFCGKFRNKEGDEAYMSVIHNKGEKQLTGICFGKNVNQSVWTGEFAGEIVSSDAYLFEIDVAYQINGETVKVKEKWEKVNGNTFKLVEAESTRPDLANEFKVINCATDFPEQQMFIDYYDRNAHIKAAKKYYQAIDVNGSVILELEYYDEVAEVTGTILGKIGENEIWTGLVTGNLIDGRTDSLRVTVEYFESGDEYYKSSQTWYINKFSSLNIDPDYNDNKPGWIFKPIELPNGFPNKGTFEKTYMGYHNELD